MKPKILYFDIETSLMEIYSFYIGQKVSVQPSQIKTHSKIICIAYKWSDKNKVEILSWDKNQDDTKMLIKFNKIAKEADFLCGHNGKNFDVKELRAAMALRGVKDVWCETPVLDTLTDCRRAFRFKSNKLDAIAKSLGLGHKDPMGLQDWIDVNNKCPKALKKMLKYCKKDVILLEKVHKRLNRYISPSNMSLMRGSVNHNINCCNCGSDTLVKYGTYTYGGAKLQKYLCKFCHKVNMPDRDKKVKK